MVHFFSKHKILKSIKMSKLIILYTIVAFGLLHACLLKAQGNLSADWNIEKLRGTRFFPYPSTSGSPFLTDNFFIGDLELSDGVKIGNLGLKYSGYKDELIYFNKTNSSQIIIDKQSIKGFSFTDENGKKRIFRKLFYDGFFSGDRFFEILGDGDLTLLVFRKISLVVCSPFYNESGVCKNTIYQTDQSYFIYSADKGFHTIKISKSSLLSKFEESDQVLIKKLLRKNKVAISDEAGFVKAWILIKENGFKTVL